MPIATPRRVLLAASVLLAAAAMRTVCRLAPPATPEVEPQMSTIPVRTAAGTAATVVAPMSSESSDETSESSAAEPDGETSWAQEMRQLKELAASDPAAALELVRAMPDKHERRSAATEVCLIIAARDPRGAALAAWELGLGMLSDEADENAALERIARRWAESDVAAAFFWASSLPPDEEARRDRVFKGIAGALASLAPATAAQIVTGDIDPDSSVRADAVIDVLRPWAAKDVRGAIAWAALFPEGHIRERSLDELADTGRDATQPAAPAQNSP